MPSTEYAVPSLQSSVLGTAYSVLSTLSSPHSCPGPAPELLPKEAARGPRRTAPEPRALPEPDPPAAARPAEDLPRLRGRRRQDLRDAPGGPAPQAPGRGRGHRRRRDARPGGDGRPDRRP